MLEVTVFSYIFLPFFSQEGGFIAGDALDLTTRQPLALAQRVPQCRALWPCPPLDEALALPDMFKRVHDEACTVVKWAVGILLECFVLRT